MADIHPKLKQDCEVLGRFGLCHLLLMRDANYPWFILVPDRPGITEIYQLGQAERRRLLDESCTLAAAMADAFAPAKLNIAALGNIVPQLHLHHIARYQDDPAWPAPVWGKVPAQPYTEVRMRQVAAALRRSLPSAYQVALRIP